jgi:1-acyl-sn-glycerol-3-phosphate acyltransferase
MTLWLRSFAFNLAFYGWTIVLSLLFSPSLLISRRAVLCVAHTWLRQMEWIERHIGGITYQVIGREYVPKGAAIIASKHQSAWETFKVHLLFGDPAVVLKKSLVFIPIWGWYLWRSGVVAIDRKRGHKALVDMMASAHKIMNEGRKIVIFPQGTRLAPGTWRPYKSGVAMLYEELKVPVVPMALNSGLLWPKDSFIKKSGRITVEFLPPIPPGLPRAEMMKKLEEALEKAADRLAKEAGA